MYCRNCGKELNENADVCVKCGANLSKRRVVNTNATVSHEIARFPTKGGYHFVGR
ncbi:zinc-ribbon domain-containing protein [Turicibacter sp. TJ11]|uniref:zinc-ribbon domain-containing protein n=1 Tax=Turicibacter sp. TJ11 TaxID=2806443 RepID=UPI00351D493D